MRRMLCMLLNLIKSIVIVLSSPCCITECRVVSLISCFCQSSVYLVFLYRFLFSSNFMQLYILISATRIIFLKKVSFFLCLLLLHFLQVFLARFAGV